MILLHLAVAALYGLAAWAHWGPDCLPRLNGMFAFSIHDQSKRVVFCARERYGVKPFYYHHRDGLLAFAPSLAETVIEKALAQQAKEEATMKAMREGTWDRSFIDTLEARCMN